MKKTILNLKNKSVGDIDLDKTIFGIKKLPDLIHQYIRYQNAKSRQGSHKTKSRSEVSGRSKKPFSQKGTGNARLLVFLNHELNRKLTLVLQMTRRKFHLLLFD